MKLFTSFAPIVIGVLLPLVASYTTCDVTGGSGVCRERTLNSDYWICDSAHPCKVNGNGCTPYGPADDEYRGHADCSWD
ncbi:hypothetical protein BST61_g5323 [Cercospora zeina]